VSLTIDRWRWSKEKYVSIKINSTTNHRKDTGATELTVLRRISVANPRHVGWHLVRKLEDTFTIDGVSGSHTCLVFQPLREPLWLYCRRFIGAVIPADTLKIILQMILQGLDYLHSECQVVHAGIAGSAHWAIMALTTNRPKARQHHGKDGRSFNS
jgi:serine/threonine-protein kinase SRPK3